MTLWTRPELFIRDVENTVRIWFPRYFVLERTVIQQQLSLCLYLLTVMIHRLDALIAAPSHRGSSSSRSFITAIELWVWARHEQQLRRRRPDSLRLLLQAFSTCSNVQTHEVTKCKTLPLLLWPFRVVPSVAINSSTSLQAAHQRLDEPLWSLEHCQSSSWAALCWRT